MNTSQSIRERITALTPGEPFTPSLFAGLGTRASIDQTLMRLAKAGIIYRVGRGLYTVSKSNRFGVATAPSPEAVAKTVAASEGAVIEIHGAEAARRLGFSTQMPTQPVFYTTGSSHTIHLGKLSVRLQHVSPRKLALAGRPAGQALSALWYLGKNQVTPNTFEQISDKLPKPEFEALCGAKAVMPMWMQNALYLYEKGRVTHG